VSEEKRDSRREFLAATTAAAAVGPTIVPSSVFGKQGQPAPSDRVVVATIGTGDLWHNHHYHVFKNNKRITFGPVCDVDRNRRDLAAKKILAETKRRVETYADYRDLCERKDVDAVIVVTPDHWHALNANYAMECGKDVYCQKPLTLDIDEGKKLVDTARRYGTVFQTGSQQRSDDRFRLACALARSGVIGNLQRVNTHINGVDAGQWQSPTTPPPELDWEMWLGPAPFAAYVPNRVHYQFRWFADYSGGKLTDWGAHHNDIAQWAIGADGSGPVKVRASGKFHENGPHDVAGSFDVDYTYGSEFGNVEMRCTSGNDDSVLGGDNGVKIVGSKGWIWVNRGRVEMQTGGKVYASDNKSKTAGAKIEDIFKAFPEDQLKVKLEKSTDHHENWLDCIKSRQRPICDVEVGHRSVTVCHLGNIALKLGRELAWDPIAEKFNGDEQANRLMSRPKRGPWTL
jgi:predicted dehydrogenase